MKTDRIGLLVIAAACIAGVTACNHARQLSDVQLTQLLRSERASATDPRAPLDASAIDCLRAWSGDAELAKSLPPAANGEAAKTSCKPRIDKYLADAARNPDKVKFEELSAPPSVRRATELLAEHRSAAVQLPSATDRPPSALNPAAPSAPAAPVDLTPATAAVEELDGLCQQAKKAADIGDTTQPLARYASYCEKRIEQMRARIQMVMSHGDARQAQMVNDNAQRLLTIGRQMAQGKAAPTKNQ